MHPFLATALVLAPPTLPAQSRIEVAHELFEDLIPRWQQLMSAARLPGLSVVCVLDDEVVLLAGFGRRDVESDLPVTPDTAFYIASATKPFVALALCALAGEGRLDLDAPVKELLPRFALADEAATRGIRVRDLLCHAPGLSSGPIVMLDAYTGEIDEERFYHFLRDVTPLGQVRYSNLHFTLAGRVLEAVSGRPWRDELAFRIFEPLGMEQTTGYADSMYAWEDVALPSVRVGSKYVNSPVRKTDRTMHAAGGLGTSARDAGQWLRLNLNLGECDDERVVAEERCQEMQTLQSSIQGDGGVFDEQGFGLGWQQSTYEGGASVYSHGGGYVGASCLISFMPEIGAGVAVFVNTDRDGGRVCQLLTSDIYDRALGIERGDAMPDVVQSALRPAPRPLEAAAPLAGQDLSLAADAYVGTYSSPWLGTFVVESGERGLTAHLGQLALALTPGKRVDELHAASLNGPETDAAFVLVDGAVTAVRLDLFGSEQRFERVD